VKLTKEQIAHLIAVRDNAQRVMDSKPKYGLIRWAHEYDFANMMIQLHNVAIRKENETLAALKAATKKELDDTGI
jgi:hypothetical protein